MVNGGWRKTKRKERKEEPYPQSLPKWEPSLRYGTAFGEGGKASARLTIL